MSHKQGETRPGKAAVVLRRDGATVVINDVPARVCENCGERVAESVLASAEGFGPRRGPGRDPRLRGALSGRECQRVRLRS
jgi:YgiT-type zinc finger domain-containing protein